MKSQISRFRMHNLNLLLFIFFFKMLFQVIVICGPTTTEKVKSSPGFLLNLFVRNWPLRSACYYLWCCCLDDCRVLHAKIFPRYPSRAALASHCPYWIRKMNVLWLALPPIQCTGIVIVLPPLGDVIWGWLSWGALYFRTLSTWTIYAITDKPPASGCVSNKSSYWTKVSSVIALVELGAVCCHVLYLSQRSLKHCFNLVLSLYSTTATELHDSIHLWLFLFKSLC